MQINSKNVSSTKPVLSSSATPVKSESAFSSRVKTTDSVESRNAKQSPISHEALSALARDFKAGIVDKDEANNRFVSAVVDGSLHGKISDKDREAMTKNIAEFFADDQEFMSKLQKNLKDLA